MSRRVTTLSLVIGLSFVAGSASADWVVLRGGKKIETAGPWVMREGLLVVHEPSGRAQALTLATLDYDLTLKANVRTAKTAAEPGAHIDTAQIKRLQELARWQKEEGARLRAQADADTVAAAAGYTTGNSRKGKNGESDHGASQDRSAPKSAAPTPSNFQALKNCAIYDNNPTLYNSCLNGSGH
jgi:hypothetical protein